MSLENFKLKYVCDSKTAFLSVSIPTVGGGVGLRQISSVVGRGGFSPYARSKLRDIFRRIDDKEKIFRP